MATKKTTEIKDSEKVTEETTVKTDVSVNQESPVNVKESSKKNPKPKKTKTDEPKTVSEIKIQYQNSEYDVADILNRVFEDCVKTFDMATRDFSIYIKPEDKKVYYVIDEDHKGCIHI